MGQCWQCRCRGGYDEEIHEISREIFILFPPHLMLSPIRWPFFIILFYYIFSQMKLNKEAREAVTQSYSASKCEECKIGNINISFLNELKMENGEKPYEK